MKNKRTKGIVIGVVVLVVLAIAGYFYLQKGPAIDSDAQDYEINMKRPKEWSETRIAIPGYGDIQMEKNSDEFNVALFNPKDNPCYFQFTIILNETKEELYQSGLIAPGKAVTNAKLNKKITTGEHPITIRINTYDLKDSEVEMNGSEVKTNIVAN